MNTKKLVPLFIALLGLALVIAALVVWFEPPKEGGVFSTAGAIISFLAGLGTSFKGWKDFLKKDEPAITTQNQTQSQTQSQIIHIHNYPPDSQSTNLPNSQSTKNTLPHQPYFFGRAKELATIADAISPDSRTWGALIDGPGGIGKTALAIKAAHDAPAELFERKIFITAKVRELTAEGEAKLTDFTRPTYLAMLDELGKELGEEGLEKLAPDERPNELRLALAGKKALIIFDNLETLPEEERTRLFQFLSRLPEGNKAIVTSRRRTDVDARIVRLDRLARDEALQLIAELAAKYPRLDRASQKEREDLYEITQGNPLFIRWIAGQLGRAGSQCRTIADACAFIDKAPKGNDPLEYIFGDLLETFTADETKVLAALTHFSLPAKLKWIAEMTGLKEKQAETALEDLTDRSILLSNTESRIFYLPPLTARFIRSRRQEMVYVICLQFLKQASHKLNEIDTTKVNETWRTELSYYDAALYWLIKLRVLPVLESLSDRAELRKILLTDSKYNKKTVESTIKSAQKTLNDLELGQETQKLDRIRDSFNVIYNSVGIIEAYINSTASSGQKPSPSPAKPSH
jgi:hypothetical protein